MIDRDNDNRIIELTSKVVSSLGGLMMNLQKLNGRLFTLNNMLDAASKDTGTHNKITRGLTWALVFFAAVQALAILLPVFVSRPDSFSYTESCGKYRTQIETYLDKNFTNRERVAVLKKIFYSSTRSSCLYAYTIEAALGGQPIYMHNLEDYFTGEKLESEGATLSNETEVFLDFSAKV